MAEKKLKSGEMDLDDDLDFDEFDFGDNNNPELNDKKSRNPVLSLATGVTKGVVSKFTEPAFLVKVAEDALPSEYGVIKQQANKLVGTATSLYDDAIKEIKPAAGRLSAKIDKLVPAEQARLKKFTGKVSEYFGNRAPVMEDSKEVRQEQAIALSVGSIFGAQQQHDDKLRAREGAERNVDRTIESKRFKGSFSVLNAINESNTKLAEYTTTVTNAYQKKSLELQFRTYFLQTEQANSFKEYFTVFKDFAKQVGRNTALPEYTKIQESERFKELAKNKLYDNIRTSIFGEGDLIKNAGNKLKSKVKEFVSGIKMGMDMTGDMAEQLAGANELAGSMSDMGVSKVDMLSEMGGQQIGQMLGGKLSKFLGNIMPDSIKNLVYKGASKAKNIRGVVDTAKNSEYIKDADFKEGIEGWIARTAKMGLGLLTDDSVDTNLKGANSLSDLNSPSVTGFDNKAAISLNQIIPGYLARIHRELIITRTGNDKTPLWLFDYTSGKFKTEKLMAIDLKAKITKSVKDSGYKDTVNRHATNLSKKADLDLNEDQINKVSVVFSKLSQLGIEYTPENVRNSSVYKEADPETKGYIDTILSKNIENAESKEKGQLDFDDAILGTRQAAPDIKGILKSFIDAGYGDILVKEKIIKSNGEGDYEILDIEKYMDFIRKEAGLESSDINVKEGISKFSPREALDKLKKTKVYNWFYRQGKGAKGEHTGPMAQDVKQNFGEEAAPGGTKIDLVTQNGNNMAAIQALDEKVDKKSVGDDNTKILALIRKDTSTLVSINREAMKMVAKQGAYGPAAGKVNDGSYKSALGDIAGGTFDLGSKLAKDGIDAGKKIYETGRDKVVKPLASMAKEVFDKAKDPATQAFSAMMKKGAELGTAALSMGTKLITDTLPKGLTNLKDFALGIKDKLADILNTPIDLYMPGINVPILRASLIEAGMYIDKNTGKVITKLSDITGEVTDKAGNIVLSNADYLKGLYDRTGKEVKLKLKTISGLAMDYALKGVVRLKDHAEKAYAGAKEMASGLYDKIQGKLKGTKLSMPSFSGIGLGITGDKTYNVLVQIRNIMLRQWEGQTDVGVDDGMIVKSDKTIDAGKALDNAKDSVSKFTKKLKGGIKGFFNKPEDDENFVGPRQQTLASKANDVKDKAVEKAKALKADLESKYKGDGNIIDTIKNKATGIFNKAENSDDFVGPRQKGLLQTTKDKATELRDKAKAELNEYKEHRDSFVGPQPQSKVGKAKGLFKAAGSGIRGIGGGIVSGAMGMLSSKGNVSEETVSAAKPKSDQQKRQEQESLHPKDVKEGKKAIDWSAPKGKMSNAKYNDSDGDGDRDGNAKDRLKAIDDRKAANKKDPVKADLEARYKDDKNIIDTMMEKASGLFSMMSSGVGGLLSGAMNLFSLKGLGGAAAMAGKGLLAAGKGALSVGGAAIKGLGAIGRGVQAVGSLVPGGAKLFRGAMMARNIVTIAGLASGGTLSALAGMAAGAASLLASPVVLGAAAVAAVGYGGYKLYKYLNRNNIDEYSSIRLKQYGFNTSEQIKSNNHLALGLEKYLQDGRLSYTGQSVEVNSRKIDMKEILTMFNIDEGDKEGIDNFTTWFVKRFKPFFLTHIASLYSIDNKAKLEDITKLKPEQKIKYLGMTGFESGPYNQDISPIKSIDSLVDTSDEIKEDIKKLTSKLAEELKGTEKKAKENEIGAKTPKTPEKIKPVEKAEEPKPDNKVNTPVDPTKLEGNGEEPKPQNDGAAQPNLDGSVAPGKVVTAGGALRDGSSGDQYIKLKPGVSLNNLKPELMANFKGMAQEFGELTGESVVVNSGSRTKEQQEALFRKDPSKAAKPGRSLHEFGLALDVDSKILEKMEQMGLMRKYGFTRPVGGEPWHTEPAGIQVNIPLAKQDSSFAAKAIESSLNKGGGGAATNSSVALGKRNTNLALATMGSKATVENNKPVQESLNENKQTTLANKPNANKLENTTPAANDDSIKPNLALVSNNPKETGGGGKPVAIQGKEGVKEAIAEGAKKTGNDPDVLTTFAGLESGLNPNAKAKTSSASGLFQFTKGTWKEMTGKYGSKYGIDPGTPPTDPSASSYMAGEYVNQNKKAISSVVQNPGAADLYAAHFLGAGGAKKLYSIDPNSSAVDAFPDAASANKAIFYKDGYPKTANEVKQTLTDKVAKKAKEVGVTLDAKELGGVSKTKIYSDTNGTQGPTIGGPSLEEMEAKSKLPATQKKNLVSDKDYAEMKALSKASAASFNPTLAPNEKAVTPKEPEKPKSIFGSNPTLTPFEKPAVTENTNDKGLVTSMNASNETLTKLVVIQTEMLNVMKNIHNAMGSSGMTKSDNGNQTTNKPTQASRIPDSALNITRAA